MLGEAPRPARFEVMIPGVRTTILIPLVLGGLVLALPARSVPPAPTNDDCFACHDDATAQRADGTSIAVAGKDFGASVHGEAGLSCTDCHADLAKAELPHAEKLAPPECSTCHEDVVTAYRASVHGSGPKGAHCADCHTAHAIRTSKDAASPTYDPNIPKTCGRCHVQGKPKDQTGPSSFEDSIHGKALTEKGLVVAPDCADCHGHHDIRKVSDPQSRVHRTNVPRDCGKCHEGIERQYAQGVHGVALAAGSPKAPVCTDCHSAHGIRAASVPGWRLDVLRECGDCHEQSRATYRETFHGQVTSLGFERVATCSDCHSAHAIFKKDDPRSTVSAGQLLATCRKCHPTARASFTQYDPHADPHDRERSPQVYYTTLFMQVLLGGVFTFFGLHTILWFPRSLRVRREQAAARKQEGARA